MISFQTDDGDPQDQEMAENNNEPVNHNGVTSNPSNSDDVVVIEDDL